MGTAGVSPADQRFRSAGGACRIRPHFQAAPKRGPGLRRRRASAQAYSHRSASLERGFGIVAGLPKRPVAAVSMRKWRAAKGSKASAWTSPVIARCGQFHRSLRTPPSRGIEGCGLTKMARAFR